MVQHADIDHTGITGVGGSVATDAIWDAKGDLAVGTGANTAAKLSVGSNGQVLTADSGESTGVKWAPAGGSSVTIPQSVVYPPSSYPADSVDNSVITPWADVGANAYATRQVEGNNVARFGTAAQSQACVVRRTLGTTRAGDFDYRIALMPLFTRWSSANDTFIEWVITQSGGTAIAAIKLSVLDVVNNISQGYLVSVNVPGSYTAQRGDILPAHDAGVFRIVRVSGSITFWFGIGSQPLGLRPIISTTNNDPYARSDSNTAARIELRLTTPSGPSAAYQQFLAGPLHDAS